MIKFKLPPVFFEVLVFISFFLSVFSFFKSITTASALVDVISSVSSVQSDLSKLSSDITLRLDSIQANVDFIAKYSEANYLYFYGDVDGRYSHLNNSSSSKSTSKNK